MCKPQPDYNILWLGLLSAKKDVKAGKQATEHGVLATICNDTL